MEDSEQRVIIEHLENFIKELSDIAMSYNEQAEFGRAKYGSWKERVTEYLNNTFPNQSAKVLAFIETNFTVHRRNTSADKNFWKQYGGNKAKGFLLNLIDELQKGKSAGIIKKKESRRIRPLIFIVHGHDSRSMYEMKSFLTDIECNVIILHEKPAKGKTIIEKIESYGEVNFAVIMYTPDDRQFSEINQNQSYRARQNVVFEHGYFIGRLGRDRVKAIIVGDVEKPGDIDGVVYTKMSDNWKLEIMNELEAANCSINRDKAK